VDVVVNALVGAAGLEPTIQTLLAGKRLALANKESLVAGGDLVVAAEAVGGGELVPVDSEHSAILQCLEGHDPGSVLRLILTASGGPFRGRTARELRDVRPSQALNHPTWSMGAKISVDSATLANKALELIEAHFLYGIDYDSLGVVIHPQSIVHSFVEFVDGSVLAQLGFPTMELPILYALSYPERVADPSSRRSIRSRRPPWCSRRWTGRPLPSLAWGSRLGGRVERPRRCTTPPTRRLWTLFFGNGSASRRWLMSCQAPSTGWGAVLWKVWSRFWRWIGRPGPWPGDRPPPGTEGFDRHVMTLLATIIVLGVLIFVHELGHFWAAKLVGVEVQRFSIGLGPRILGREVG
jgi:hypothetical protein